MTNGILPHKSCLNIILKEMHRNLLLSFSESTLTYLSKYTSSGEDFATLQSLIINSLMKNERKLFVNEHEDKDEDGQYNGFRSRRWYSHGFEFSLRIPRNRSAIPFLFF